MKTVYVFLLLCLNYTIEGGPANQIYHRKSGYKSEQVLDIKELQREKDEEDITIDDPNEELLRRKRSHILGPDGRSLSHDTPEGRGEKEENGPSAHSKPSKESIWSPHTMIPPFVDPSFVHHKPLFPDRIFHNLGSVESAIPQESENSKIIEQQNTTEKKPERTDVTNQQSNVPEKESIDPPPFCC